jgi:hypothetical protein
MDLLLQSGLRLIMTRGQINCTARQKNMGRLWGDGYNIIDLGISTQFMYYQYNAWVLISTLI